MSAWGGLLNQSLVPPRFSTGTAGAAGIANSVASLLGNYTGGILADACFRMRLKAFLVLLFAGCAVSFAGYSLALPSLLSSSPLLPSGNAIVVWTAAAGFFQGSLDPVLYELSAEIVRRPPSQICQTLCRGGPPAH